jgi:hypothetical protein
MKIPLPDARSRQTLPALLRETNRCDSITKVFADIY